MEVKRTNVNLGTTRATAPASAPTAEAAPRRGFDDAFARLAPKTALLGETTRSDSAAPALPLDVELVADLTNRRVAANTTQKRRKEETKAREILDANDREIAIAAEAARENAGRVAQDLNRDAAHAAALARAEVDARIATDNGVTPLASKVVKLPSTAPVRVVERAGARLGPGADHLALKLRNAFA